MSKLRVVSANYNDRHSERRWLVRKSGEPSSSGHPVEALICGPGRFVETDEHPEYHHEKGLGCRILAECETATENIAKVEAVTGRKVVLELSVFDRGFFEVDSRLKVTSFKELMLHSDGKITAVI